MKMIAFATAAALALNVVCSPISVLANEDQKEGVATPAATESNQSSGVASVRKFNLYGTASLPIYDEVFKMPVTNIKSITNNGGNYSGSPIKQAIDGDFSTHWETGKPNSSSFTNEVVVNFNETTVLNRIVYAARQSTVKGKGFAQGFEIYGSQASEGDDFSLVSTGSYKGSTGDIVEIQFAPTELKRVKFVFTKADQDWASASEFQFYKEDWISEAMDTLFTDASLSSVNEQFNTLDALLELDAEAKGHPLYTQFKEDIENAKVLINNAQIEATPAITKQFAHYSNEAYSRLFRMDRQNVKSIRNNGGHYANSVLENAFDGNLNTYWETNRSNTSDFSNEVEVEFHDRVTLNRLMYGARPSDRKGFAEEVEIYASNTSKGDTYQLVATGQHNMVAGLVEVKFAPTEFKRVKFKFKKSNQNWATLSELAFYREDPIEEQVINLFTDGLMNELKPEFTSMYAIQQLENQVEKHPLKEEFQHYVTMAKDVLNNANVSNESIVIASQRGNSSTEASKHQIARTSFSLDTFGRYVVPGETVQVTVEADEKGVMPNLVLGQIADDKNGWVRRYVLKQGLNRITVPAFDNMKPAVAYVENNALPTEQAFAPKVRLVGGTAFPVYVHGKTDPAQYEKELEKYVTKISVNDNDFANGKPENVVYNVSELVSENNTISTSAAGALKGIQELKGTGKTVSDTMKEWELMWMEFQRISGAVEDDPDPRNQFFNAKFTSRVFTKGPYAWSDWGYTGYNGGNSPRRDDGFFKQIVKPFSVPGNDGWAYFHEWGHNINNSTMEHTEVTNNIYSVIMRKKFNNSTDDRVDWNSMYKRFSGETVQHGFWTYLGVLEQVQYYYGEDSYGKASRIARTNPDGVMNGLGSNLQRLVVGLSLATETDLTGFFEDWGYVTATPKMKEKVAHLSKPDVKLEYMHSLGRNYEGAGFSKDAKVVVQSIKANPDKKEINLSYEVDTANKEAAMGYEVLRNGKVVGYTTGTSFIDKNVDTSIPYSYEIVAYDRKLTPLKPVEIHSQQPNLSVEEQVTLKLHQVYDPMDYVKASSFSGQNITQDVVIKSNTVDVTAKGSYEIVYEVKNANLTETKTTKVAVTSDYTYISDMNATSVKTDWSSLQKDKAISGGLITLSRQGSDAAYPKGIAIHANSEVVYDIAGKGLNFFESYIGIDQSVRGQASSATFEVWVDGEKKLASRVFKSSTEHEFVKVPVTGAKEVKLITTDAKDNGISSDHTVWADAKFTKNSSAPTLKVVEDLTFVKLNSDFTILDGVEAYDKEDGNLTDSVKVTSNNFTVSKTGTYHVVFSVTDSDGNTVTKTKEIYVYSDVAYASDTNWKSAQTAWSTVKKNQASSGGPIKVLVDGATKEFTKGIGTHANSSVVYDLADKNYDYFETLVGIDRNIAENNNSSVTFKVLADGQEVYSSGVMKYNTEAKLVRVPLAGVKELTLIANDASNGNASDHANFAIAKFYISNGLPELTIPNSVATKVGTSIDLSERYSAVDAEDGDLTAQVKVTGKNQVNFDRAGKYEMTYTVTDRDGNEVSKKRSVSVVNMEDYNYLSDFDWKSTQNSYKTPVKDRAISDQPLRLTGKDGSVQAYEKGIGAHSNSTIIYDLTDKAADYFTSYVGVDRQMAGSIGSVAFQVFVDGVKQFDSGLMHSTDPQKFIEVKTVGAKELKLVVTDGGNGNGSDHATWGGAKLHFANAERIFTRDLVTAVEDAKAIDAEKYTIESMDELQKRIANAEELLANAQQTQTEIDQALDMLLQAKTNLVELDFTQVIAVPDKYLRTHIQQKLGITGNLTIRDLHKLTSLDASNARINSLEGLQYARNLVSLDVSGNEITDFSPLKNLGKLKTIQAHPQLVSVNSLKGPVFTVENLVKGLDGQYINPYQVRLRNTRTNQVLPVDVDQFEPNLKQFTIDLSQEEKGTYMLVLAYQLKEDALIQLTYYVIHN
ncbi:NPCBM/NEW2 domain-containing protein [Sporosarcina gallistercoris]|uniref:NPCBM/NEW2 domain-containing protein n=1 Tax=Sporosarcina gallistercoris TaxID=2762245 RepID=A0ABR8PL46_9BACL|nr:NPCBM/NEW2 domain-containing protein [Sporosarcina gallistercoris]MBD7908892.1 NPCBM/NEW2 domain-containing protein [Sporosarcina gallistercoris]